MRPPELFHDMHVSNFIKKHVNQFQTSAPIIFVKLLGSAICCSHQLLSVKIFSQHQAQGKINFSATIDLIRPDSIVLKAPFTGASVHMIGFVLAQLLHIEK